MPLSIVIRLGNEHDYRRLIELVEGLWEKHMQLYADAVYDTKAYNEWFRIYRYRA